MTKPTEPMEQGWEKEFDDYWLRLLGNIVKPEALIATREEMKANIHKVRQEAVEETKRKSLELIRENMVSKTDERYEVRGFSKNQLVDMVNVILGDLADRIDNLSTVKSTYPQSKK